MCVHITHTQARARAYNIWSFFIQTKKFVSRLYIVDLTSERSLKI